LVRRFTIIIDQQSLKNLHDQVIQTPDQHRWLGKLLGYDFEILYRPSRQNGAADALSRSSAKLLAFSSLTPSILEDLKQANNSDLYLQRLHSTYAKAPHSLPGHTIKDGLMFYKDRVYVPPGSPLCQQLLHEFHSSVTGGHVGITRTFHRLESNFYWSSMRADVKQFVASCQTCQQMKASF
jgi:hypothetical protein